MRSKNHDQSISPERAQRNAEVRAQIKPILRERDPAPAMTTSALSTERLETILGLAMQVQPRGPWIADGDNYSVHRDATFIPDQTAVALCAVGEGAGIRAAYIGCLDPDSITSLILELQSHRAVSAQPVGDWVLVPREPSEAMLNSGSCYEDQDHDIVEEGDISRDVYRAMLAAAPQPTMGVTEEAEPIFTIYFGEDGGALLEGNEEELSKLRKKGRGPHYAYPALQSAPSPMGEQPTSTVGVKTWGQWEREQQERERK